MARQAILTDPDFNEGHYARQGKTPTRGLRIARMMGHITYLAEDGLGKKFGRDLRSNGYQYGYDVEFEVESYLRYQGDKFAGQFDANTYLLMTKALDYFDPAADFGGNLTRALQDVQARFFVASFSSDWRFSPERSKELVKALIAAAKPVQYIEVKSFHGHDAFLMEDEAYIRAVRRQPRFGFGLRQRRIAGGTGRTQGMQRLRRRNRYRQRNRSDVARRERHSGRFGAGFGRVRRQHFRCHRAEPDDTVDAEHRNDTARPDARGQTSRGYLPEFRLLAQPFPDCAGRPYAGFRTDALPLV